MVKGLRFQNREESFIKICMNLQKDFLQTTNIGPLDSPLRDLNSTYIESI